MDEERLTLEDLNMHIAEREKTEICEWQADWTDNTKEGASLQKTQAAERKKTNEGLTDLLEKIGVNVHSSFKTREPRFPLCFVVFQLLQLDPDDEKLRTLSQDLELTTQLRETLTKLGPRATDPLKAYEPFDLQADARGLFQFLSFVLRYLVQAKPGLLLDFLLQQKPFFNLLLRNCGDWCFGPGELRKNFFELKLHSLIDFDMDNVYAATKDFQENVVTFLNFAVKEEAPFDVVMHAASLATLGYRSLMRENQGRYLKDEGDVRNPQFEKPSDFPSAPSPQVIQYLFQVCSGVLGNDATAVALAFLRNCSKVELMRTPQPTGVLKDIFAGLIASSDGELLCKVVKGWPQTRSEKVFLHGTTTDIRVLYLDLWVNILESGVAVAGEGVSPEEQRVFGATAFDYFSVVLLSKDSSILRVRASRGLGLVLDKYPSLIDQRGAAAGLDRLLTANDEIFVGPRLAQLRALSTNSGLHSRSRGGGSGGGGAIMSRGTSVGGNERGEGGDRRGPSERRLPTQDDWRQDSRSPAERGENSERNELLRQIEEEERKREKEKLAKQIEEEEKKKRDIEELRRQIADAEAKQRAQDQGQGGRSYDN